ncbi:NACHT domain-containing protein [Streptomyces sp. NPDC002491]
MHVDFAPDCNIDARGKEEIEEVLGADRDDGDSQWEDPVNRITVLRRVSGSRTGAEVLEVALKRDGGDDQGVQQVAKIDWPDRVEQDWRRFKELFSRLELGCCTPVQAVTRGVLDGTLPPGERGAVFYQHVRERAGMPDAPVYTLEQLAIRALEGSDEDLATATACTSKLLDRMGNVIHREARPDTSQSAVTLGFFGPRLGPALVVEVDNALEGSLHYRRAVSWSPDGPRVTGAKVRNAAVDTQWIEATTGEFAVGSTVTLHLKDLKVKKRGSDEVLEGIAVQDVTVQVRLASDHDTSLRLSNYTGSQRVHGRIVGTRSHLQWNLLKELLQEDLRWTADEVRLGGQPVGHPLGHLENVLHGNFSRWIGSLVHGDLNPRNALFVGDDPFLIDYAEAEKFHPLASDYAWLEFGLLRDVIAPRLSHTELLRLCRVLCLISRCPALDAAAAAAWACDETTPAFRAAYQLLFTIRDSARRRHPNTGGQPWWKEYLCQLTLAACRTLKWSTEMHDEHTAAAAVAASGVAGEFLRSTASEAIFQYWQPKELHFLLQKLLPQVPVEQEEGLLLFAAVLRSFDSAGAAGSASDGLEEMIDLARVRAVQTLCTDQARQTSSRQSDRTAQATIRLRGTYERHGRDAASTASSDIEEDDALTLATRASAVIVLGDAGTGKTTLAQQLAHLHALAVLGEASGAVNASARLPILVSAAMLPVHLRAFAELDRHSCAQVLQGASPYGQTMSLAVCENLLSVGGLHVTVDGLNELTPVERDAVTSWLGRLRLHYPRAPFLLCHRSSGFPARALNLDKLTLCKVTKAQACSYIEDRSRQNSISYDAYPSAPLIDWLFHNPADPRIEELACTPLFLNMTVEWYNSTGALPASVGELLTRFTHWYLSGRLEDEIEQSKDLRYDATEKAHLLGKIASFMVEGLMSEVSWDRLSAWLLRQRASGTEEILKEIFDSEMLWREGDRVGFLHQLFQEYFAARELASCSSSMRQRRVLAFRWQEPVRILLGLPEVAEEVTDEVLATARQARPAYAAWLLRHAHLPPLHVLSSFLSHQQKVLETLFAGPTAWQESAEALAELATPQAWQLLRRTVCSTAAPLGARQAALRFLGEARREASSRQEELDREFGIALDVALGDTSPPGLKEAAFRAAGRARVTAFAGFAWEHVAAEHPWSVTREAYHAVKMLGLRPSPALEQRYLQACTQRLQDVVQELRRTSDTQTVRSLNEERFAILSSLAYQDTLEVLLRHRFAPGLVDRDGWAEMIARAARHRLELQEADGEAATLLTAVVDTGALLQSFTGPDDLAALAAAHRLLTDCSVSPREVLERVHAQSSPLRLLAAAAFVEQVAPADLGLPSNLIRGLLQRAHSEMPVAQLDALSALTDALGRAAPALRAELADEASLILQARRVTSAMRWPWLTVWSDAATDSRDLAKLLERPDRAAHATAVRLMSGTDFLLCAAEELPRLNLSEQALHHFQQCRPDPNDGPAVSEFAGAVAFGGIIEEYDFVLNAVKSQRIREISLLHANSRHGILQRTCADNAVAALGYLGRLLLNRQDPQSLRRANEAKHTLLELPTDLPASLERARRIALGLLGDWQSLLFDLSSDPLLRDASFNIITKWEPAPWAPDTSRLRDIAVDVTHLLSDPEFQDPAAREVLQRVKADLQDRIGSYVLAGNDDPGYGREAV